MDSTGDASRESRTSTYVYAGFFQKQEHARCGLHALNNCVGSNEFTHEDMKNACQHFVAEVRAQHRPGEDEEDLEREDRNMKPSGWYSSEVMAHALLQKGTYKLDHRRAQDKPDAIYDEGVVGVVVNDPSGKGHWFAIRRSDGELWKLDSLRKSAQHLTDAQCKTLFSEYPHSHYVLFAKAELQVKAEYSAKGKSVKGEGVKGEAVKGESVKGEPSVKKEANMKDASVKGEGAKGEQAV